MSTTNAPAPVSARREKTRQRLMAAAETVIADQGFAAASVEEICDRAGFTRGAFYSNFADKDELAYAMLRANAQAQIAAANTAIADALAAASSQESVEELVGRAVDTFLAARPTERAALLLDAELRLHAVRNPAFGRAYAEFSGEMSRLFTETIAESLRERGLCLRIPDEQAVSLLYAVHAMTGVDTLIARGEGTPAGSDLKALVRALLG